MWRSLNAVLKRGGSTLLCEEESVAIIDELLKITSSDT
jgi:hypothetical protein